MSKDVKPKKRIGKHGLSTKQRIVVWAIALGVFGGGGYAAYYYGTKTVVEVPVAKVSRGTFVIAVSVRGEIKSTKSRVLNVPQVPSLRVIKLATSGSMVKQGDVIVEFDASSQENTLLDRQNSVKTAESSVVQTKASHKMTDESDALSRMTSEYSLERAKLEASKAEILSAIQGAKNQIDVGTSEGSLNLVKTQINSHKVSQQTDLLRLANSLDNANKNLKRVQDYLDNMVLRAPADGMVNILPNATGGGDYGRNQPAFKEGDTARAGVAIAEIPDLSSMRVELRLDEADRGMIKLGQLLRVRIDAIPDKTFEAQLDYLSPIASLTYRGTQNSVKEFPVYATLKSVDPRFRPGMSASVDIIVESQPDVLMIPLRASFSQLGKPVAYVQVGENFQQRSIKVGERNDDSIVVLNGLKEGELVAQEDPAEAARKAKKKKM
jgi:multidrug efflux pump subunit AcrA (membrane-fusion protein)